MRLKRATGTAGLIAQKRFLFQIGAIKTQGGVWLHLVGNWFLFQIGAIKTLLYHTGPGVESTFLFQIGAIKT